MSEFSEVYAHLVREALERNLRKASSDDIDQQIAGSGKPAKGIMGSYPNGCPVLSEGPQKDDL